MSTMVFHVSAQGVDPDLTTATGQFDAIDLGNVGIKRLEEVVTAFSRLKLPDGLDEGKDVCPPQLIVSGPRGELAINLADDEGTLYCDALGVSIGLAQVMMAITGQPFEGAPTPRAEAATSPQAQPAHCPKCREPLESGDQFCAGCGLAIEAVGSSGSSGQEKSTRPSRKKDKQQQAKVQIQSETGKDLEQLNQEVIHLMAHPLPLHQYRERFPFLLEGATSKTWETLKEHMFRNDPPAPIHARLTAPPCDWAIQKPGWLRRLLTLIVDGPLLIILFGLVIRFGPVLLKSAKLNPDGWAGILILLSFPLSFIGFYTLTELFFGASIGGFLVGLRVIDDYGKPPTIGFLIIRQVWKILDIVFFFLGGAARIRLPATTHVSIPIPELLPGNVVIR